jgi:hypothetical protein
VALSTGGVDFSHSDVGLLVLGIVTLLRVRPLRSLLVPVNDRDKNGELNASSKCSEDMRPRWNDLVKQREV